MFSSLTCAALELPPDDIAARPRRDPNLHLQARSGLLRLAGFYKWADCWNFRTPSSSLSTVSDFVKSSS